MGMLVPSGSFKRAEAVLTVMQTLIPPDEQSVDLYYCGFKFDEISGFQISNRDNGKRVNVYGDKVTDGFRVTYGFYRDFNPDTGETLESGKVAVFNYSQVYNAAHFAINWLLKGITDYGDDPTFSRFTAVVKNSPDALDATLASVNNQVVICASAQCRYLTVDMSPMTEFVTVETEWSVPEDRRSSLSVDFRQISHSEARVKLEKKFQEEHPCPSNEFVLAQIVLNDVIVKRPPVN